MMRALAALLLCLVLAPAVAQVRTETAAVAALKLPPSATSDQGAPAQSTPAEPQPHAAEKAYYLISADAIEQINAFIEWQEHEIARLRAAVAKGSRN